METSSTDLDTLEDSHWRPTGIDPTKLGVLREDDPEGYLKAYRAAYGALHKAEMSAKSAAKYAEATKEERAARELRRSLNAGIKAQARLERMAKTAVKKAARAPAVAERRKERQLRRRQKQRKTYPEKYHERRLKKVKWAGWVEFKPIYDEARTLTGSTGQQWDVEHIYPVKSDWVCGLHTPANLRVATRAENMRKGSRPFGPCLDELWEPDHYRVYWPGESMTLSQKRDAATADERRLAKEAKMAIIQAERLKARVEKQLEKARLTKKRGRKPMTREQAAQRPDVQALLGGCSIRDTVRRFGVKGVNAVRYARLVDPDYQSPFHKHGRPRTAQN